MAKDKTITITVDDICYKKDTIKTLFLECYDIRYVKDYVMLKK